MLEGGPLGLQGHSLGFLRLRLRLRLGLWFWRQLLFFSIHLAAGQASGWSPPPPKCLSELICLFLPVSLPGHVP